jgi:hypothetical protein
MDRKVEIVTGRGRIFLPPDEAVRLPPVIDLTGFIRPGAKLPSLLAIRERDHLVFEISWSGLQLKYESGEPLLTRTQGGDGYLMLVFAPQNLAEKAYYQILKQGVEDRQFNTEFEKEDDPPSQETIPVEILEEFDHRQRHHGES